MTDAKRDLKAALVEGGMRRDVAAGKVALLIEEGFIRLNDEGTAVEYRRLDDVDVTYPTPKAGTAAHSTLVKKLIDQADPNDLVSNVDRGGGSNNGAPAPVRRAAAGTAQAVARFQDDNGQEVERPISKQFLDDKREQMRRQMGV
jgi:hypothetical protein